MSLINVSDFIEYVGKRFNQLDWDTNWNGIVNALNSVVTGKDIAVPSVTSNEFTGAGVSNDTTLAADSSTILPTQHAVKSYVDNQVADSIGTVQLTSANGNISTTFVKAATHKFLRFAFSGAALGNVAGSVVLKIAGNTKMTWTTQGPPATWTGGGLGAGANTSGPLTAASNFSGAPGPVIIATNSFFGGSAGTVLSTQGETGASGILNGQDWFDITSEANGNLAIDVTFTNITNGSAAIYRNRV